MVERVHNIAEAYIQSRTDAHFHIGRVSRFYRNFRFGDYCTIYKRSDTERIESVAGVTNADLDCGGLRGGGRGRQDLVFVLIVEFVKNGQRMKCRVPLSLRLHPLDKSSEARRQTTNRSATAVSPYIPSNGNWKSRASVSTGPCWVEVEGETPDSVIQSAPGVVDAIADKKRPFNYREGSDMDAMALLSGSRIDLDGHIIRV